MWDLQGKYITVTCCKHSWMFHFVFESSPPPGAPCQPLLAAGLLHASPGADFHRDDHPHHWGPSHPPRQTALPERLAGRWSPDCWDRCNLYLLYISGAVLGNVLAEAPERLLALSKLSRQELQEVTFSKLSKQELQSLLRKWQTDNICLPSESDVHKEAAQLHFNGFITNI